jgi:hypothetical protein
MIQPTLNPVQLFLFVQPGLRKRCPAKRATTSLQQLDHRESVVALRPFDTQPRPNAS